MKVKRVLLMFDEKEHAKLLIKKGEQKWEDYILQLAGVKKES